MAGKSLGFDVMGLRYKSAVHRLANEIIAFSGHKLFPQKYPSKWGLAVSFQKAQFLAENVVFRGSVREYGVVAHPCPQAHPLF